MTKNLITLVSITAVIIIIAAIFRPAPTENKSVADANSVLVSDATFYDFGEISMAKGTVAYEFKIQNSGNEKIDLDKIYTSCMCTSAWLIRGESRKGPFGMQGHGFAPPVNEFLESGEEAMVKVIFDPAAHGPAGVGTIERSVFLEGNGSILLELKISATVKP